MKQSICIIMLFLLMLNLSACEKAETPTYPEADEQTHFTEQYGHVCVDIASDGGYYALTADTELEYYKGEVVSIYVREPTVLAYQLPDSFTNGAGIIDGNDLTDIKERINEYLLTSKADEKTESLLSYILQQMDSITLHTGAST